jgi:hypothetical protein
MMRVDDIRQRTWDYALTIATVVLLAALGVQSFLGTIYVWWAQSTVEGWEQVGYAGYVARMNLIAAPMLIMLVVVMGLCVPKRLFSRTWLMVVSLLMVGAGIGAWLWTSSLGVGVTVYLALAALIQLAVVVLTIAGVKGPSYLTEGRLTKTGSGLLHLGFVLLGIVVAALQHSTFMLPFFWTATALMVGGTALSFWANKLAFRRTLPVQPEGPIEL